MRYLTLSIRDGEHTIKRNIYVPDDINNYAVLDAAMAHIQDLWPGNRDTEIIERHMAKEMTP